MLVQAEAHSKAQSLWNPPGKAKWGKRYKQQENSVGDGCQHKHKNIMAWQRVLGCNPNRNADHWTGKSMTASTARIWRLNRLWTALIRRLWAGCKVQCFDLGLVKNQDRRLVTLSDLCWKTTKCTILTKRDTQPRETLTIYMPYTTRIRPIPMSIAIADWLPPKCLC